MRNIRDDQELVGTKVDKQEYKARVFAYDVICIVEEPRRNIKRWLYKIEELVN